MKTRYMFLILVAAAFSLSLTAQTAYPFQNPALSDDARLDNLLSLMTLDEKVNSLNSEWNVPRLGIRRMGHLEGLHGAAISWNGGRGSQNPSPSTTFPQSYGLGETWDTDIVRKAADLEATEMRYYAQSPKLGNGMLIMRAPNADLARDPRWGRTEESFGEDAYLTARMTVAFVKGLQGDHPKYWKAASLMKHFMANSNEDGRDSTSSDFDERLFREYYGYPFYKGITEGGSQAFMASYNAWNGVPMTVNPILESVTRKEWGNKGIICTDGGAFQLLLNAHHYYKTAAEGAAAVIKAGVGQFLDTYRTETLEALRLGLLTEKDIDHAIRGNFYVALKLGLLDGDQINLPYANIGVTDTVRTWEQPETRSFVRELTAKSAVLLKNSDNLLPIDKNKIKSIAVIGPRANDVLLDWYSGTPPYAVSVLDGIRNAVGKDVKVNYAYYNEMDEATIAAANSDVAIVVVGNHVWGWQRQWKFSPVPSDGREAIDRKALGLEQEELLKLVRKANPNTVMVLLSSFPYAINWSQENVPAIIHLANNSQELGNGLADVIFGDYNPAGRTTQTWVKDITDLPPMMDYDLTHGRTYMFFKGKPLYAFGHGLSYTTFAYSNLNIKNQSPEGALEVSVDVKNTGKKDGDEVVQLYVAFPNSKVQRPVKQLKGFSRVNIPAGETRRVDLALQPEDLSYWSTDEHKFVIEPGGKISVMIGASSEDIRLRKQVELK
ncbi:MAG: glycoside hydrolase family 3 C-terminal domain-containing protein [Tannerellaceae bacterium]|jgi:beta-glucosidase|nr:glycoside hydrolase family 3 C-terminal domain-containing protein [Tannerellaceae bacterium]